MSHFCDPKDGVGNICFLQLLFQIYMALVREVTHSSAEPDNSVLLLVLTLQWEINSWKSFSKLVNIQKLLWGGREHPNQVFFFLDVVSISQSPSQPLAVTVKAHAIQATTAI